MEKIKHFQWDDSFISLCQEGFKIWEIDRSAIRAIAISEVVNGDNDTTIFTIIDNKANMHHLDMLGLKRDNYLPTYKFFEGNYEVGQLDGNIEGRTVIFYPKNLVGEYPYEKSLRTWIIRTFFNAGGGILKKRIKKYVLEQRGI